MKRLLKSLPYILLIPFFFVVFRLYYQRISAFSCFDDCFNYMGGYFLLHGKQIYSQFFYNHQPLMAYISFIVQKVFHPSTIYTLLVYHRVFALLFGFFFDCLIIFRFRKVGVAFVIVYELTKYYLFGDRFLAEGLIIYPLVYLMGLVWFGWQKRCVTSFEILANGIAVWFVIFAREPYIPLVLLLYGLLLWTQKKNKSIFLSCAVFSVLSLVTVLTVPLKDYFFNVFTINQQTVGTSESESSQLLGMGGLKVVGYPVWILISSIWNPFKIILFSLDILFLFGIIGNFIGKRRQEVLWIVIILALANIRFVTPGAIFYEAFHMLPWYALFVFITFLLLDSLAQVLKKVTYEMIGVFACVFLIIIFSPSYFIWDKVDRQTEFVTNFGDILSNGGVIKALSTPSSTLFLDGHDDMIYWQSGLLSPYRYGWYTSIMPRFPVFVQARLDMFRTLPPDFYYSYCPTNGVRSKTLPDFVDDIYQPLYFSGKSTCVFIKKTIISSISEEKWNAIKNFGYYLPKN